ncbi:MAG: glycosyltransferase family 4 protein [Verrucomicrobiota bacterium]|jgi:glycosyltransferase involved in cell wall biosynthesis
MKILWLCNSALTDVDGAGTGTWLGALAHGLLDSGALEFGIVAFGPVNEFTRRDHRQVKQWLVPAGLALGHNGLPSATLVQSIVEAVREFAPDLIHVWGTEAFWGLLTARGLLLYPSLLEIQGLKAAIGKVFYGGLTLPEQLRCIGFKELLKRRTMHADRRDFKCWGKYEAEIIRGHRFIDIQTSWGAAKIADINVTAKQFLVSLPLRRPFYNAEAWQISKRPAIFCSAAYPVPFKGLHVAIRALALLRKRVPDARLRIAGAHQRVGIRQDGYMRWVNGMIWKLGLTDSIEWLGPLTAEQIVKELQAAAAMVIPTFIETYCLAFVEAMAIGTPVVASYVGGLPSVGKDEESCLFFPVGDESMSAYQLERVLTDKELAQRLSRESRKIALVRNDLQRIVQRLLDVYRQVLGQVTNR